MKWSIFLSNLQQSSLRLPGTASLSSRMSSMSLNSGSASVGTNTALLAKECSSQTNASGATASYRAVGLGIHHSQPLVTAIAPDLDPLVHGPKSLSAHYGSTFGYENSAYCPVILHMWLPTLPLSLIPLPLCLYLSQFFQPQPQPPMHHTQQFPSPMPPPPHALGRVSSRTFEFENNPPPPPPCPGSGPIAMSNGTIQLRLREGVRWISRQILRVYLCYLSPLDSAALTWL